VGRGDQRGYCLLLSDANEPERNDRLRVMTETTDGFKIAEEDLRLRGPGEMLGTRQHGLPEFRVANLATDADLLMRARDDANALLTDDPMLTAGKHRPLRDALRAQYEGAREYFNAG
jgi:ATP-dependent DNA helicase RecG